MRSFYFPFMENKDQTQSHKHKTKSKWAKLDKEQKKKNTIINHKKKARSGGPDG